MAISGHCREASLRNHIDCPSSVWVHVGLNKHLGFVEVIKADKDETLTWIGVIECRMSTLKSLKYSRRAIRRARHGALSGVPAILNNSIFSDALSGRPHQSQQPSFTAISYRAIFMFLWIRLSFIHKTHALSSLCSSRQVENSWVFISFNSAGFRWTFHFQILYLRQNLQANVSNSTCRTIPVCKQLQIVNFDGL